MKSEKSLLLLDEILTEWKVLIGDDYDGYRNHVRRMVIFCFAIKDCTEEEQEKIVIAGAFHDIGIWINNTVDYIPPSLPPAMEYLRKRNRDAWSAEIALMITEHHKIGQYKDKNYPLVEVFRQGDLVDFSFGLFKFGICQDDIKQVQANLPNAGFHKMLGKRALKWLIKNPLNPVPMMKR